jgi:hypothetical protein
MSKSSVLIEERLVDVVVLFRPEPQSERLEHLDQLFPVNQLDGRRPITDRFPFGVGRKVPGCQDDPLVCATLKCAAKIANGGHGYGSAVPLALEQDLEENLDDGDTEFQELRSVALCRALFVSFFRWRSRLSAIR